MDGLLIVDKPVGPTSHDVVARVRQALGERRVGHTGTLDPAAGGVLPMVVGRATRLAQFLSGADKVYEATLTLGMTTDTYDALGQPAGAPYSGPFPGRETVEDALDRFRGTFVQQPPAFSAKKVEGTRSYRHARAAARAAKESGNPAAASEAGERQRVERPALPAAVLVTAHAIDLLDVQGSRVVLRVHCSAGFYLRSLAHDLGERLGTGACLAALTRTRCGDAALADAVPLATIERDRAAGTRALIPLSHMLPALAAVVLTGEGVRRAVHGREVGPGEVAGRTEDPRGPGGPGSVVPLVRLLDESGDLVGIAEPGSSPGFLHPSVVLK
ncbi:MAG: tRNA pseudouridine(55) synthase TruB [Acidobacteria bacterium RIFCSPLOWO2_02_FULL_65_29]|nr:MAG: tRNA pseudouridine(55) synthase TruB [Acidobacteria bacterium RIFCSPLOWO2_02_FULL_65_29]